MLSIHETRAPAVTMKMTNAPRQGLTISTSRLDLLHMSNRFERTREHNDTRVCSSELHENGSSRRKTMQETKALSKTEMN